MQYKFMIFKDGSYIIASKMLRGSLTWLIKNEDIIESSENINKFATNNSSKTKSFSVHNTIRGIKEADDINNIYRVMITFLFLYSEDFTKK